jgi:hypothetical protein
MHGFLDQVIAELSKYEHPLFEFNAVEKEGAVELRIRSRIADVHSPEYRIVLAERDLAGSQFPWKFQKLLYDCLTDYMVELFTKSPMTS